MWLLRLGTSDGAIDFARDMDVEPQFIEKIVSLRNLRPDGSFYRLRRAE